MMFKNYLRVFPSGMQLCIFMCFFLLLMSLGAAFMPALIRYGTGRQIDLAAFVDGEFVHYPRVYQLMNIIQQVLMFLLPALIFAYLAHPDPLGYLGLVKPEKPRLAIWALALAAGMLPALLVLTNWLQQMDLGEWARSMQQSRERYESVYFQSRNPGAVLWNVLLVGIIPAICEEIFFRGIILKFLHTWLRKPWLSIICSALVFASVHGSVYNFLPITITGIVLAWVYFQTSSLWLNILLHLFFNSAQVLLVYVFFPGQQETDSAGSTGLQLLVFGAGAALMAVAAYFIYTSRTPLPKRWGVTELPSDNQDISKIS